MKYYSGLGARAVPGILLPVVEQLFEINHLAVSQQWAKSQGCPWDFLKVTARRGHFEVLQCARGQGHPWDRRTCSGAARGGYFEVLQWATRSQGCPCNDYKIIPLAAAGGHLEV